MVNFSPSDATSILWKDLELLNDVDDLNHISGIVSLELLRRCIGSSIEFYNDPLVEFIRKELTAPGYIEFESLVKEAKRSSLLISEHGIRTVYDSLSEFAKQDSKRFFQNVSQYSNSTSNVECFYGIIGAVTNSKTSLVELLNRLEEVASRNEFEHAAIRSHRGFASQRRFSTKC